MVSVVKLFHAQNKKYSLTKHPLFVGLFGHSSAPWSQFETILINISRGTGFDGITGMNYKSNKIFRPLISFTRSQIEKYAIENKVDWREDSSNLSNKYLRNFIRNNIFNEFVRCLIVVWMMRNVV